MKTFKKLETLTKFKTDEDAYRWRDDKGYWHILRLNMIEMGFREVRRSEHDKLEERYQEWLAEQPARPSEKI